MQLSYVLAGAFVLVVVVVDALWTTLWVHGGAGPLTSRGMSLLWGGLRPTVGRDDRLRTLAGPVILLSTLAVWLGLLWGGWTLVFAGAENALIDTRESGPISWGERFYFVGYTVFTLGNGDFAPRDGVWQTATAVATATGMLFVTLSVTYVLSVLDAVTQKRAFASDVTGLGDSSGAVLRRSWDGETFAGLELPLNTIASELNTLTSNHKAYPILHYFDSARSERAPVVAVAVLDEALTTLRFGVTDRRDPSDPVLASARSSVGNYLETLQDTYITAADEPPPPPDLEALREAGVPTVDDGAFEDALEDLGTRRRQLRALVESDRREWPNEGEL